MAQPVLFRSYQGMALWMRRWLKYMGGPFTRLQINRNRRSCQHQKYLTEPPLFLDGSRASQRHCMHDWPHACVCWRWSVPLLIEPLSWLGRGVQRLSNSDNVYIARLTRHKDHNSIILVLLGQQHISSLHRYLHARANIKPPYCAKRCRDGRQHLSIEAQPQRQFSTFSCVAAR